MTASTSGSAGLSNFTVLMYVAVDLWFDTERLWSSRHGEARKERVDMAAYIHVV